MLIVEQPQWVVNKHAGWLTQRDLSLKDTVYADLDRAVTQR